jgi:hypothetical protein
LDAIVTSLLGQEMSSSAAVYCACSLLATSKAVRQVFNGLQDLVKLQYKPMTPTAAASLAGELPSSGRITRRFQQQQQQQQRQQQQQ